MENQLIFCKSNDIQVLSDLMQVELESKVKDSFLLQGLRDVTKQQDALLCFDEVMTGFR